MKTISLNGKWKCKPDFDNLGSKQKWYKFKNYNSSDINLMDIDIPKSFNLLSGYETYEGIFWHFHQFDLRENLDTVNFDYISRFKGSNYNTKIWINGNFTGSHDGGFTPFEVNLTKFIKLKNNFLVVRTENTRRNSQVPSISFDWFNWGGIYRNVDLMIQNKHRINDITIRTVLIEKDQCKIEIDFKRIGMLSLRWEIRDTDNKTLLFNGSIPEENDINVIKIIFNNPKLWSPEDPNLYLLKIFNSASETSDKLLYETTFGIRQIEVHGTRIYLNKKKINLRGISLHEEYLPYGRSIPYNKRKEDVENIKRLGFNAIRTAHYSHDEDLIDLADKVGILILEEIPLYQHCDFKNPQTYDTAKKMLQELIKRDINHPSVIWWSVGNENPLHKRNCARFIKKLIGYARELDSTRIVTCVSRKWISDLTRKYIDVATINAYFGWYYPHEKMINLMLDVMRTPVANKPWIYTEFGAGAKYGFRVNWNKQQKYSEENQLQILESTIKTLNSKDFCAGWFIWIYRDFKSIKRTNRYQQGFNRKGIVSGENNDKKLIFYRLPKIMNKKSKKYNSRLIGIILWIIFFPLSYFVISPFLDNFLRFIEKKPTYFNQ
ncbi:MAG: glycoside hydrolase family 2 protein [Promethearchaeota archaeon]|jgi:beta-glucuronidase